MTMNNLLVEQMSDLSKRQRDGEHMRCPRCGEDNMDESLYKNALSRHVEGVYVCSSCGIDEALHDWATNGTPVIDMVLDKWWYIVSQRISENV